MLPDSDFNMCWTFRSYGELNGYIPRNRYINIFKIRTCIRWRRNSRTKWKWHTHPFSFILLWGVLINSCIHSSLDLKQTVTDSSSFEKWYSPLLVTNRRKITLKSGEAFTPLISLLGRYLAQMQPLLSVNRVLPPFSNSCDLSQSSCCVPV